MEHNANSNATGERLAVATARYFGIAFVLCVGSVLFVDALGGGPERQTVAAFLTVFLVQVVFVVRGRPEERGLLVRDRWAVVVALGALIVLPAAAAGGLNFLGIVDEPSEIVQACPTGPSEFKTGPAVVNGHGPEIHSEASVTSQVVQIVSTDCKELPFVGYCIGDVVVDATHPEVPDSRWFILPEDQGLIPSAQTVGNPPAGMAPQQCRGGVPPPARVAIREAAVDPGQPYVRLAGYSRRAAFVGFALELPRGKWRRIGWDRGPEDSNSFAAELDRVVRGGTQIAGVACIAVENPARPMAIARLQPDEVAPVRQPFRVKQPISDSPRNAACAAGEKVPK